MDCGSGKLKQNVGRMNVRKPRKKKGVRVDFL